MMFHGRSVLLVVGFEFCSRAILWWPSSPSALDSFRSDDERYQPVCGTVVGIILDIFRPDLSRQTEFLLYSHELILYGIGLSIILLLICSGEIFRALRGLAAERK
jgi:hypothetical protein